MQRDSGKVLVSALLAGALALCGGLAAQAKTWDGGDGNWTDSNWDGGGAAPLTGETAVLPAGAYTVTLSASTPALASFTQNGGTLLFTNWNTCLSAGTVDLTAGTITCAGCDTNAAASNTNRVWIAASNVTVGAGAAIDVDGKGYRGGDRDGSDGQGPGGAIHGPNATDGTAGGSYGGKGGRGYYGNSLAREPYGSASAPDSPGSGGAGRDFNDWVGGNGGGAVRIQADGAVVVNGTISADGGGSGTVGAGSGGGIWISCRTFDGSGGVVRANGQRGGGTVGSGGGGGRVAITYDELAQQAVVPRPDVDFSASHGSQSGYYSWPLTRDGRPGTVYFSDAQLMNRVLSDDEGGQFLWGTDAGRLSLGSLAVYDRRAPFRDKDLTHNFATWVEFPCVTQLLVSGSVTVTNAKLVVSNSVVNSGTDLVLDDYGRFYVYSGPTNTTSPGYGARVSVADRITIASNSWIFPYSYGTNGASPVFETTDLYITASNGGINADLAGYESKLILNSSTDSAYGPGGGGYRSGGGYGGAGGGGKGGGTYGSSNAPTQCGSAGSFQHNNLGYRAGGLVRLDASGTVSINGTVTANGGNLLPTSGYAGGGSGGGVWIKCRTLLSTPNAVIRADGGHGGSTGAGAGGGGRLAIWYGGVSDDNEAAILAGQLDSVVGTLRIGTNYVGYSGLTSVKGGTALVGGEDGTIVFLTVLPPAGTLISIR